MTASRKNEIIAQLMGILNELIEVDDSEEVTEISPDTVEMLKHRSGQGTVRTYDSQADSSRQAPLCKNRRGR